MARVKEKKEKRRTILASSGDLGEGCNDSDAIVSSTWRISWKNWFRLIRSEKFKENLGEKFFGGGGFYEERGLSWTSYYR